tara:strand:+ start:84 stop:188 length:105 start_codon:yes stop_codon:yes gene_type:complete
MATLRNIIGEMAQGLDRMKKVYGEESNFKKIKYD